MQPALVTRGEKLQMVPRRLTEASLCEANSRGGGSRLAHGLAGSARPALSPAQRRKSSERNASRGLSIQPMNEQAGQHFWSNRFSKLGRAALI